MAERRRAPVPPMQDRGKSKKFSPSSARRVPTLGPEMRCCLSKTLTPLESDPMNPILYLDAYEAGTLTNLLDIINSPPVSFEMTFRAFDVEKRKYDILLSHCVYGDWVGYSLTEDWDLFVMIHNLEVGDTISFHRSLERDDWGDYSYILTYVKKKDQTSIAQMNGEDQIPDAEEKVNVDVSVPSKIKLRPPRKIPLRPGSGFIPNNEAPCFSRTLTPLDVDEQNPKLHLTIDEVILLTGNYRILYDSVCTFSEDLVVFDSKDRRYTMNLSNQETGSPMDFFLNTGWNSYIRRHDLKQGYVLSFYRLDDESVYSEGCYYVLLYFKKPQDMVMEGKVLEIEDRGRVQVSSRQDEGKAKVGKPITSTSDDDRSQGSVFSRRRAPTLGPEMQCCLSKTITPREANLKNPILYLDAYEAGTLTDLLDIIDAPPASFEMTVCAFDVNNRKYDFLLSQCVRGVWVGYSLTKDWDRFFKNHDLEAGDTIFFHRIDDSADYYYIITYVKKIDRTSDAHTNVEDEIPETEEKVNVDISVPSNRRLKLKSPKNVDCFSMTLTSLEVAEQHPKLHLSVEDVILLTDNYGILYDSPGTFSQDIVVFDSNDTRYTMNLTNQGTDSPADFFLDTGWNSYVRSHDLKQGDEITFCRFDDRTGGYYYVLMYVRKPSDVDGRKPKDEARL